jgi:fatty acid hydroxylase domain-containing protein 2
MDFTSKPAFLTKYKIQPEQNVPLDYSKFIKSAAGVLFNQTVVEIPYKIVMYEISKKSIKFPYETTHDFTIVIFDIIMLDIVYEFVYYYSHRAFHHPSIYKHVHKIHHEWTASVSIIAIYSHWLG